MTAQTPVQQGVIALRQSLSMTRDDFAAMLGVSVYSVGKWETNGTPHAKNLNVLRNEAAKLNREDLVRVFMLELMHRRGNIHL